MNSVAIILITLPYLLLGSPVKDDPNGVCQYGGNAACLAACAYKGFNCGYCSGTEPNEVCICEHCPDQEKTCIAECQEKGCESATVSATGCECNKCSEFDHTSCECIPRCDQVCVEWGFAPIGECTCQGCMCSNNGTNKLIPKSSIKKYIAEKTDSHPLLKYLNKTQDLSCTNGGEAACILSCKVQGCRTGHCVGTAPNETCVCSGCGG